MKDDNPARKVIKGSRWLLLLLRNRDNIVKEQDRVRLARAIRSRIEPAFGDEP